MIKTELPNKKLEALKTETKSEPAKSETEFNFTGQRPKSRYNPRKAKLAEQQAKVEQIIAGTYTGILSKPKSLATMKQEREPPVEIFGTAKTATSKPAPTTFSGLAKPLKSSSEFAPIETFIKQLQKEEIVMGKTTEDLISRLDEFHSRTSSLQAEAEITLAYAKKLPAIRKEEKRLLKESVNVPRSIGSSGEQIEEEAPEEVFKVTSRLQSIPEELPEQARPSFKSDG